MSKEYAWIIGLLVVIFLCLIYIIIHIWNIEFTVTVLDHSNLRIKTDIEMMKCDIACCSRLIDILEEYFGNKPKKEC